MKQKKRKKDIFLVPELNFKKYQYDPCLLLKHDENQNVTITIALYVDDVEKK